MYALSPESKEMIEKIQNKVSLKKKNLTDATVQKLLRIDGIAFGLANYIVTNEIKYWNQ